MCGIAGIYNLDGAPASSYIIKRMTDAIAHRGPDSEGQFTEGSIALGHRRLAIIDLTPAGHQPMQTHDGRYVISYNGEVYNYRELRTALKSNGYRFHTGTDTEVVLNAFAHWGARSLDRLNGMFAFAIWDRREEKLFLARDRYGMKPLYYTQCGDTLLFASEIKAFMCHPDFSSTIDQEALLEYFTFQNLLTDRTLFKNVKILPAGCFLAVDAKKPRASPSRYWDFQFEESEECTNQPELTRELAWLFNQAVNRQLVSDVEVGSYLSGGIDSGSITAIAASQLPRMPSFTCGFDLHSASSHELNFDERQSAEHMSYLFKTEHYEMVLKAADMERVLPKLTWHLEEPRVGQSYPNFCVAQLAGKFVKVVLSGVGGDELFGGYPWRYYQAAVNHNFEDYVDKYYAYWQRLIPAHNMQRVFGPIWDSVSRVSTRDIFRDVLARHTEPLTGPKDYINQCFYFEAKTFLHGLLVVEDKLSMSHSLETRVPFLDNDLVEFAMRVPVSLKLGNLSEVVRRNEIAPETNTKDRFKQSNDGKLLLRKAMKDLVPSRVLKGVKQGFSGPDASWFKGESIDYVRDTLGTSSSPIYNYLDRGAVWDLVDEHLSGQRNRRLLIWSLLFFDSWCRQFDLGAAGPLHARHHSRAA